MIELNDGLSCKQRRKIEETSNNIWYPLSDYCPEFDKVLVWDGNNVWIGRRIDYKDLNQSISSYWETPGICPARVYPIYWTFIPKHPV